jgi:hypothetical protein
MNATGWAVVAVVIGLPALLQAVAIVWSVRDRQRRSR